MIDVLPEAAEPAEPLCPWRLAAAFLATYVVIWAVVVGLDRWRWWT